MRDHEGTKREREREKQVRGHEGTKREREIRGHDEQRERERERQREIGERS